MSNVKFENNSDKFLNNMKRKKEIALEAIGMTAEGYAKKKVHVDTGRLRASITHTQLDEDTEGIGSNVDYAAVEELGGIHHPAHPYLKPAVVDYKNEYENIVNDVMKNGNG